MIHWTKSRKQAILEAIAAGTLSESEACETWDISPDELLEWHRGFLQPTKTTRHRRKLRGEPTGWNGGNS